MSTYLNQNIVDTIDSVQIFAPIGDKIKDSGLDTEGQDLDKLYFYASFGFDKETRESIFFKTCEYMFEQGIIDTRGRTQMVQEYSLHNESPTFERVKGNVEGIETIGMKVLIDKIHETKNSDPMLDIGIVTEAWLTQNYSLLSKNSHDMPSLKLYADIMNSLAVDKSMTGVMSASPTMGGKFTVLYEQNELQKCVHVNPQGYRDDVKISIYDTTGKSPVKEQDLVCPAEKGLKKITESLNLKAVKISEPVLSETEVYYPAR